MIEIIKKHLPELTITTQQAEQLQKYYQYLIEQNALMNLTTITNEEEVYYKHFLDSLLLLKKYHFTDGMLVCDVGSGAGFPGIVLKIFVPQIRLTIIEALEKRCRFLRNLVQTLSLTNVEIIHDRVEQYSRLHPEQFDLVLTRAVANLSVLLELVSQLVKVTGTVICYKGPKVHEEINGAQKTFGELNFVLTKTDHELVTEIGERYFCYFTKMKKTPWKYPRHFNQIKKSPIG
ncbi:16S rRNA (guanine(527)-N(7))-methyltransferase RsmG [Spiroplasma chrysopicola]|uniref:Ribosomal RNA small subunit methyltransferase G n=1 Tax=Spiroplasma chrysopicola DF-1 TaxID=1276227 RepID=R4UHD5_9MOLU|nr:16S rRNA (guanine(527)-N(7))-methyltransferase RsmG [Spiroplasma chrysopicola]AGM24741.1 16S rRNA methyltransferase GidB [Spiroplasma chrysopicola DF-1]